MLVELQVELLDSVGHLHRNLPRGLVLNVGYIEAFGLLAIVMVLVGIYGLTRMP